MRYLIIGGGIAGTTAAEELRKLNKNADITILSEESHRLYSRVLLPHYLKGKIPRERCFLKKPEWYSEQNIEFLPEVAVVKLDVRNKFVLTTDGREFEYDKLLIATGGEVKTYEEDRRGVSYLRTLDDADHLLQLMNELPANASASVLGGGFIALEYLNLFADRKIDTTLFLRGERFFGRTLDQASSHLIEAKANEAGVKVEKNADPKDAFRNELVGVGIGIAPDLSWIEEAGVKVCAGIEVNEFLETNVPDVYAAGDVAEYMDVIVERRLIIGNWLNAIQQGRAVAKSMMGDHVAFELVSSYATNARGMEIIFVGDTDRAAAERVDVRGTIEDGGVLQLFVRKNTLVGATLVNRNTDRANVTKAIKEKLSPDLL